MISFHIFMAIQAKSWSPLLKWKHLRKYVHIIPTLRINQNIKYNVKSSSTTNELVTKNVTATFKGMTAK